MRDNRTGPAVSFTTIQDGGCGEGCDSAAASLARRDALVLHSRGRRARLARCRDGEGRKSKEGATAWLDSCRLVRLPTYRTAVALSVPWLADRLFSSRLGLPAKAALSLRYVTLGLDCRRVDPLRQTLRDSRVPLCSRGLAG